MEKLKGNVKQVRALLWKNAVEDRDEMLGNCPRSICKHTYCCTFIVLLVLLGILKTSIYIRYEQEEKGDLEIVHRWDGGNRINKGSFQPMGGIFFRGKQESDPCGGCYSKIFLQGSYAREFKEFVDEAIQQITNRGFEPRCAPEGRLVVVDGNVPQSAACARVEWGDEPEKVTIHVNRTRGYTSSEKDFYPSWKRDYDNGITKKRCTQSSKDLCERMSNDPDYWSMSHPWYSKGEHIKLAGSGKWRYISEWLNGPSISMVLQILVGDFAISKKSLKGNFGYPFGGAHSAAAAEVMAIDFPVPEEERKPLTAGSAGALWGNLVGSLVSIVFMINVLMNVSRLVTEREEKRKEGLRMVGCSSFAYYAHWIVYAMMQAFLYAWANSMLWFFAPYVGYVSHILVFPVFWWDSFLFFFNLAVFGFVMSTFLSTVLTSQLLTMVVYIGISCFSFLPQSPKDWLFMFFPQFAYGKALSVFITRELSQWRDLDDDPAAYSLTGTFFWLLMDSILWVGLWLYLDQVIPHQGVSKKPWFLCDPAFWQGDDGVIKLPRSTEMTTRPATARDPLREGGQAPAGDSSEAAASQMPPHWKAGGRRSVDETMSLQGRSSLIEPVDRGMQAQVLAKNCVKVDDLCVYFRGAYSEEIRAVDGVNLIMFPGEIFALLGHNGAGKSTTMSAICGLTAPTKGTIAVYDLHVPEDLAEVRKSMGFCPQHDVLFPAMTVVQHLELFSTLAGRTKSEEADVFKLVSDIGLHSRANYQVTKLSGGMKRKLSVGLSFSGDPRLVILDEPTSGMDPFSRRSLWDFLKLRRQGRVMLLTTHFMDEAGVLGDRVAIMRAGAVQACGTGDFLKRRFGCGYVLTIVMKDRDDDHEPVKQLLQSVMGQQPEISGVGKEILVNIPMELETQLSSTLAALGEKKAALSVATFGVSVSNLEEVFLKVASGDHGSKKEQAETETSFHAAMQEVESTSGPSFVMPNAGGSIGQQIHALLGRRASTAMRDKKTFLTGCVAPIAMLFFATLLASSIISSSDPPGAPGVSIPVELNDLKVTFATTTAGTETKDVPLIYESDKKEFNCGRPDAYDTCTTDSLQWTNPDIPDGWMEQCKKGTNGRESTCTLRWVKCLLAFDELLLERGAKEPQDVGVLFLDGYPVVAANTSFVAHGYPLAVMQAFEKATGLKMAVTSESMPVTALESTYYQQQNLITQTTAAFLVSALSNFAFCFVPVAVLGFALMEKTKEVKHQLMISGCSARAYWISMLLWDCFFAAFPILALYLFLHLFGFEAFSNYWESSLTTLLLFTPAAVGLAYVLSHLTSSSAVGNVCLVLCNGICALMLVLVFIAFDVVLKGAASIQTVNSMMSDPHAEESGIGTMQRILDGDCDGLSYRYKDMCNTMALGNIVVPIMKVFGFFLPGFSLVDGLLRITMRHMIVYLALPQLMDTLAEKSGSMISSEGAEFFVGCGEIINLKEVTGDSCQQFDKYMRGSSSWGYNYNGCILKQHGSMVDDSPMGGLIEQVLGSQLEQMMGPTSHLNATERERMQSISKALSKPSALLAFISTQYLINSLPETERDEWLKFRRCVDERWNPEENAGLPYEMVASILARYGEMLGERVTAGIQELGKSPNMQRKFDKMLPPISGFGECVIGPDTGVMHLADVLPQFLQPHGKSVLGTNGNFGPITLKMPCDLGNPVVGPIMQMLANLTTMGGSQARLAFLAVFFPLMAILLETLAESPIIARKFTKKTEVPPSMLKLEDEDVKAEKERVQKVDPRKQVMYVNGLRKAYGSMFRSEVTHAVRGVTWAVDQGMVFGLLGVNGAGKTTSFKLMSGILTPSAGEVRILGIDMIEETSRARRLIGYCPQFDALIHVMTVEAHLYLYGRMKGITGSDLTIAVNEKISEMQLEMYRTRMAGTLSGGNKRKLSVAMALIGEPPVIFLDEPSTGMDPFARRFMWSVIQDVAEKRKQSVVVLTTHSMEEAEALCSQIAIQVDGQFRCFGSAQHLKSRYGSGYEVSAKFQPVDPDALAQKALTMLPTGRELDRGGYTMLSKYEATNAINAIDPAMLASATEASGPMPEGQKEVAAEVLAEWLVMQQRLAQLKDFFSSAEGLGHLNLGEVIVLEMHGSSLQMRLPNAGEEQLPELFATMTKEKARLSLSDFAVCQSSLEQVFNGFAAEAGGRQE